MVETKIHKELWVRNLLENGHFEDKEANEMKTLRLILRSQVEGMWIQLTQDRVQWWTLVFTVLKLRAMLPDSHYLLTPWFRTLFEKLIVTQPLKKNPAFFMEPEGSLPCSQKPAIVPYTKPAESSSPYQYLSP
jgi:hypothetical protein